MMNNAFNMGGGTLLIAVSQMPGGGVHDRNDQRGSACHHRPGVSGGDHHRLRRRDGPQQHRWLRDAVAAHRGRADADSVGCKPSRWMGGRRSDAYADRGRDACAQSCYLQGRRLACGSRHRRRMEYGVFQKYFSGIGMGKCNILLRRQRCPQQHATVTGRLPLEARGISYAARKGAAEV